MAGLAWRLPRLGFVPQVVLAALLAVAAAVGTLQAIALDHALTAERQAVETRLTGAFGILKGQVGLLGEAWTLEDGRLAVGGQVLNDRNDIVDAVQRLGGGVATVFAGDRRVATNVKRPDGSRAVGTTLAPGPAHTAVFARGETYRGVNVILGVPHRTIYEPVRDAAGRTIGILFVGIPVAEVMAQEQALIWRAIAGAALVGLAVCGLIWLVLTRALRPLRALAACGTAIGEGDLARDVSCTGRHDVLGEIARAVLGLRDQAREARRLEAETAALREAAEGERRRAATALATDLEQGLGGVAGTLRSHAEALGGATTDVAEAAIRTGEEAALAAGRAREATGAVQSVAAAAEELATSVTEISRRVAEGAAEARQAAEASRGSDATIQALTAAADRIGDVVRLIADIAGRTNLLALNATIEAARAGEAGRGFAVVAGEVKSLAAQTARATGEIGEQIAAMRDATGRTVAVVREIGEAVGRMEAVTLAIGTAIEEQGSATQEIARSAALAASGTGDAAAATERLGAQAEETKAAVGVLRGATASVAEQEGTLRRQLDGVLGRMRAA